MSNVTKKRPPADQRKAEILETALTVFARDGFHRADVQVIADDAGVGKGTVYRHFGNKEGLFLATSRHCLQMIDGFVRKKVGNEEDTPKLLAEIGAAGVLKKVALACAEFYQKHPETVEIMIHERAEFRDSVPTHLMFRSETREGIDQLIKAAISSGEFRKVNVEQATNAFGDLIWGSVINGCLEGGKMKLKKRMESAIDIFSMACPSHKGHRVAKHTDTDTTAKLMSDTVQSPPQPIFAAHDVTKVYKMGDVKVHALRGATMELFRGELVVLLGPSGSGKSTLLNILGGLDTPTSGTVTFQDEDLTAGNDTQLTRFRREHVGFVFQFYNLIPSLTARENVALVTEIAADPLTPEEALRMVGLGERLDHFPLQMSGGEQQRVAIARAIAKRPEVLLCDEPTGALDAQTGVIVLEVLERINREMGTTTAVITHNAMIAEMADRVISLSDGRISEVRLNATKKSAMEIVW